MSEGVKNQEKKDSSLEYGLRILLWRTSANYEAAMRICNEKGRNTNELTQLYQNIRKGIKLIGSGVSIPSFAVYKDIESVLSAMENDIQRELCEIENPSDEQNRLITSKDIAIKAVKSRLHKQNPAWVKVFS